MDLVCNSHLFADRNAFDTVSLLLKIRWLRERLCKHLLRAQIIFDTDTLLTYYPTENSRSIAREDTPTAKQYFEHVFEAEFETVLLENSIRRSGRHVHTRVTLEYEVHSSREEVVEISLEFPCPGEIKSSFRSATPRDVLRRRHQHWVRSMRETFLFLQFDRTPCFVSLSTQQTLLSSGLRFNQIDASETVCDKPRRSCYRVTCIKTRIVSHECSEPAVQDRKSVV